jgi:5'-nucleotidase
MRLLLTNDDGINALGLQALAEELSQIGQVIIAAPSHEQSGMSHAFTHRTPLRVRPHEKDGEFYGYAIDGMPVDCVMLGLHLSEKKIDWVVSGINAGANLGVDIFYSGTVQAAIEGTLKGYRSIAFSLADWHCLAEDYKTAARLAKDVFLAVAEREIPPGLCLNVNIPKRSRQEIKGIEITHQAYHSYQDSYDIQKHQDGAQDFQMQFGDRVLQSKEAWLMGEDSFNGYRTDLEAVRDGKIAITPIRVDLTHTPALKEISRWKFKL